MCSSYLAINFDVQSFDTSITIEEVEIQGIYSVSIHDLTQSSMHNTAPWPDTRVRLGQRTIANEASRDEKILFSNINETAIQFLDILKSVNIEIFYFLLYYSIV